MEIIDAFRKSVSQLLHRLADFVFLWDAAVAAAIYLGQTDVSTLPNAEWVWLYNFGIVFLLDFCARLLEKE